MDARVALYPATGENDIEGAGCLKREFEGLDGYQQTSDHSRRRAVCWIICSSIGIFNTKFLLVEYGFHYPLTLSTLCFVALLIVCISFSRAALKLKLDGQHSQIRTRDSSSGRDGLDVTSIWMIPAAIAAAVSLPLFMEAILHMPSLPLLVLLFPISSVVESLILVILSRQYRSQLDKPFPMETLLAILSMAMVLYNEYRLTVPGLVCGVSAYLSVGICRAFFAMGSNKSSMNDEASVKSQHLFFLMTTMFGFAFSAVEAFRREVPHLKSCPDSTTSLLIFISMISFIGTSMTGSTFLLHSPISFSSVQSSQILPSVSEVITSFSGNLSVILAVLAFGPLAVLSWVQIAWYLLAILCLLRFGRVYRAVEDLFESCIRSLQFLQRNKFYIYNTITPPQRNKFYTYATIIAGIVGIATLTPLIAMVSTVSVAAIPSGPAASLDLAYSAELSPFDIVVSSYSESPESIARMLKAIKSTSYLSTIKPRVILYTKNSNASLSDLKELTGADVVEKLPNLGREGATYLHHMVSHWDDLATQTMFIQAHAHNIRELIPRIHSYLVPQTGMLSLSFSGSTCSCKSCGDRFSWTDDWSIVPTLYENIYHEECTDNTSLLLSYKGQFVVSAKRIRGISRLIYEDLLNTITSASGWSHDPTFVKENDSPDNPSFGFVVERIWGLLMQCASDERVAVKCPSLLSGMSRGGSVEDCQCMDPI